MNNSLKMVKEIKEIKEAYKKFDRALEKELNTLDIDPEKLLQAFYIFIGGIKYTLRVSRSPDRYIYKVTLLAPEKVTACYIACSQFDINTGDIKIIKVYLNNIGIDS